MRATELGREFLYTATRGAALVAFLSFFLLLQLATAAGLIGLWLLAATVPALIRYLMLLLDARARDRDSKPPGIELFSWFGSAWSLVPIIHLLVLVYTAYLLARVLPAGFAHAFVLLYALLLPASLAVLAVTRTPVESVRPGAIAALIRRCGPAYGIAPGYIVVAAAIAYSLQAAGLPEALGELIVLYLVFAGFAVTGGLIRPFGLYAEVAIPELVVDEAAAVSALLEREREAVLNHAYGFVSRGNRSGGLQHIEAWLEQDPEADAAWSWFIERMLAWESRDAGLQLAQGYLGKLLGAGESLAAVKLMLRCRLISDKFLPLPEDRELAYAAAVACQHEELATLLE